MLADNWDLLYRLPRTRLFIQNHWMTGVSIILAALAGLFTIKLGVLYSLGLLVSILAFIATLKYPEFVILLIISYVSNLLPVQFNYSIRVAGRAFLLTDFLFFSLMAALFLRLLTRREYRFVKTPLDIPLFVFSAAVIIGVAIATSFHGVNFSYTTPEARMLLYYLMFFPVTNLIRSEEQLNRLIRGLFLIGILMALMMVGQAIFGSSINLIDQSSLRGTGEIIRFYNPGTIIVYPVLMILFCSLAIRIDDRHRYWKFFLIILLGVALLLTLDRNLLISSTISFGVLAILLRKRKLSRLVFNSVAIAAIGSGIFATIRILGIELNILKYSSLYFSRFTHLFATSLSSPEETLAWRWNEIGYAWQKLMKSPILGIGLFTPYRPPFYPGDPLVGYVHNAYLLLWLKTGLLGLLAFLWLSVRFLSRGFRSWRKISNTFLRATILGLTLTYLAMVISNLVAPWLVQSLSTAVFGTILGINEVIYNMQTSGKISIKGDSHYG